MDETEAPASRRKPPATANPRPTATVADFTLFWAEPISTGRYHDKAARVYRLDVCEVPST